MIEDNPEGLTVWCDYCSGYDETFDVPEEEFLAAMEQAGWGTRNRGFRVDHMCPSCMEDKKPW